VDLQTAAAGDAIALDLMRPMVDEAGAVIVRPPALVVGRILRVQHFFGRRPYVNLKWRVESIQVNGKPQAVAARPLGLEEDNALLMNLPGTRVTLRKGTVSRWVTE
jgi:hypothetical protein